MTGGGGALNVDDGGLNVGNDGGVVNHSRWALVVVRLGWKESSDVVVATATPYLLLRHYPKMVTLAGSQCETFRSSMCQQTVICFLSTTLLAMHESYGFSTKPSLSELATSLL
jgi:hypothetical protein